VTDYTPANGRCHRGFGTSCAASCSEAADDAQFYIECNFADGNADAMDA
jgi:hypothetical protein